MRILTGELKGRQIKVPKGNLVRPTSSRIKKSIFDTIGKIDKKTKVLDIFSGSGSLGLEALSLGAHSVLFVEKNRSVAKIIKENIENFGYKDRAKLLNMDYNKALSLLRKNDNKFGLIFIDPPYKIYEKGSIYDLIELSKNLLNENGMLIIEHNTSNEIFCEDFLLKTKKYGETMISYLWRKP